MFTLLCQWKLVLSRVGTMVERYCVLGSVFNQIICQWPRNHTSINNFFSTTVSYEQDI